MDTPRMVTLDRDTMSGYLLNVLGTDQIHDFCGYRLQKAFQMISNREVISNKRKDDSTSNKKKKKQKTGGNPALIDLTDYEFIEQQCLEIINIFVNTIFDENNSSDLIVKGGEQTPKKTGQWSDNNSKKLTESPNSVTDLENIQPESDRNSNLNSVKKNLFGNSDDDSQDNKSTDFKPNHDNSTNDNVLKDNFLNIMEWGTHVTSKIELFTKKNHTNYSLNYICIDDVINIFELYLKELHKLITAIDMRDFKYFITLYVESMKYFISPSLTYCYNNIQTGGEDNPKKPSKSVISNIIKQMAFTFCDISGNYDNCGDWKKSTNWECFEIGLLKNNISTVESMSSKWIRENIIPNKPKEHEYIGQSNKKQKLSNMVPVIKQLKSVFDVTGNCVLKEKTQQKHIIANSVSLNEKLKPLILENYPSFIDSQSSDVTKENLLEKMEIYNCGFQDPSGNQYYKIIMTPSDNTHTISIRSNNNEFKFTKQFTDFTIYNKNTQKSSYATRWKDVTLCVALINAFENMSSILKDNKITDLQKLINSIVEKTTKEFEYIDGKKQINIIELFYMFSLFKGLGDISQEMSSVIKYGGGNNNTYSSTNKYNYEAFDTSGNALRFFLARDRLSANRFILTLKYGLEYELKAGKTNNINSKAYGGYLNVSSCKPNEMYLIEANQPLPNTTTGGNKKHSRKYKNSKRKRKNHTKNTRNKHNNTYKLYKKNT